MQSFPINRDETSLLEQCDDKGTEWAWSDTNRRKWEEVTNEYQQFYEYWRENTNLEYGDTFPYKLSLGVDPTGTSLLPFRPNETLGGLVLVTKPYDDMFHRLLYLRGGDMGTTRGAVVTGQPGIGKTTFLKYMLVRLISARQVVLLCDNSDVFLFYCGRVYTRPTESGFGNLPKRKKPLYCPIWALIDVNFQDGGPPITGSSNIWPIQTSSPNPAHWKSWHKQYGATLLGMPLWNMEELIEGFCLRPEYTAFRRRLEKSLPLPDGLTLPTTGDKKIDAVLEVLQTERQRRKEVEVEEGHDEMGDGIGASATDQDENMVDKTGQPLALVDNTSKDLADKGLVDNALKILVRNATEEFGFVPVDVYAGVFDLPMTKRRHAIAVKELDYPKLRALFKSFSDGPGLKVLPHRVVVVYPCKITPRLDDWKLDFKSIRIARKVMELMRRGPAGEVRPP